MRVGTLHLTGGNAAIMPHHTESWLTGDWVVLGTPVPHWAMVIAALIMVALLVAWLESPNRTGPRISRRPAGN